VFSLTLKDVATPDAERAACDFAVTEEQRELSHLLERVSVFYLRSLDRSVPSGHPARMNRSLHLLFKYASNCISLAESGKWPFWKPEWNRDDYAQIDLACNSYSDVIDVKLLRTIGDNLIAISVGDTQAIEVGMRDNMLADFYQHSLGFEQYTKFLARIVKQITHRYPHAHILEIGAGTGGATRSIFKNIEQAYDSYTFTDVAFGFFSTARGAFEGQHGMVFKVLDINRDPRAQGFKDGFYDIIVASMVLHATEVLEKTLRNVRCLLRPGGYLVFLEGLPETNVRSGAIFGAFPGWWAKFKRRQSVVSSSQSVRLG
jgi:hybrid polyketide synthase / nonribosomal peptide synthetase ACE1